MCELPRSTAPWHPHISHSSGCLQGGKKSLAVGEHSTPCFPTVPCTGVQNPPLQAPQIHTAQCHRGWISRGVPPVPHPHVSSPFTPLPTEIHRSYFFNGYLFFYMGQYRGGWGPTLGYPMLTPTQSPQGAVLVGQTDPHLQWQTHFRKCSLSLSYAITEPGGSSQHRPGPPSGTPHTYNIFLSWFGFCF